MRACDMKGSNPLGRVEIGLQQCCSNALATDSHRRPWPLLGYVRGKDKDKEVTHSPSCTETKEWQAQPGTLLTIEAPSVSAT